jgi:hypothetical protein
MHAHPRSTLATVAKAVSSWLVPLVLLLGVFGFAERDAHADLSKKVIKTFKGQLIVSSDPVQTGATDKETIASFKAAKLKEVKGEPNADDVQTWHFHYTAFLKKKAGSDLTFEFYTDGKYVADQRLEGVDASDPVIEGDISITEDDGPTKGKKYTLKLVGKVKGKDVTVATATITMD